MEWKKYSEEAIVLMFRHSYAVLTNSAEIMGFSETVLVGHCTCMAGLAETWSHVGAVMHWL